MQRIRLFSFSAAVPLLTAFLAVPAQAATVGLCNTGFAASCGALINNLIPNQIDGNYVFTANPHTLGGTATFVVTTSPTTPDPLPSPWIPDDTISQWIGPASDVSFGNFSTGGIYVYRINFSTTAPNDVITGRWAADNTGTLRLNGTGPVLSTAGGFTLWTPFSFSVPTPGTHFLEFTVDNFSNATGMRAEFTGVPEPGTVGMAGAGAFVIAYLARRRRQNAK